MISNNVKTKWAKKETVLNSFLSIANPFTAEIMSEQGYDALTIDHQHGMIAFNDVLAMLVNILQLEYGALVQLELILRLVLIIFMRQMKVLFA